MKKKWVLRKRKHGFSNPRRTDVIARRRKRGRWSLTV